jgi:hypothetical protein
MIEIKRLGFGVDKANGKILNSLLFPSRFFADIFHYNIRAKDSVHTDITILQGGGFPSMRSPLYLLLTFG